MTLTDFNLWKTGLAGRPNVTMRTFPKLNPYLSKARERSRPEEYEKPGHVAADAIDTIATWVLPKR